MSRMKPRWIGFSTAIVFLTTLAGVLGFLGYPWGDAPVQAQASGLAYTCSADDIGATLTRLTNCIGPVDNMRRYVTDIVAQSTTTTAGQMILRYGTGTNCGTGTTSLFPSSATGVRVGYPANTSAPTVIVFRTPLVVPTGKDLCVLAVGTNTVSIQVNGYVAP
jgi:hypothetical protein